MSEGSGQGLAVALARTVARAGHVGFFFDFDGTLAPILSDPEEVIPAQGVIEGLAALVAHVSRLAVVSSRPVAFLRRQFAPVPEIALFGVYGLERADPAGTVRDAPGAGVWMPLMTELAARAGRELPAAVGIELKRFSVALHFRACPDAKPAVEGWAAAERARFGLRLYPGRQAVELIAPVDRDKGTVIRDETADLECAWYFGDDLTDLAAFRALDEREAADPSFVGVRAAVRNSETGAAVAAKADVVIDSPDAVAAHLGVIVERLGQGRVGTR
jgi:trehalose 6-phosphate phosphatase